MRLLFLRHRRRNGSLRVEAMTQMRFSKGDSVHNHVDEVAQEFLERVQQGYLRRECIQEIDLRPPNNGTCRRYRWRNLILWLDDAAHKRFREGLERDQGFLTNSTYEHVLNGHLSCGGLPPAWAERLVDSPQGPSREDVICFGEVEKRSGPRIKRVVRTLLVTPERVFPARTRDVSASGIQVRVGTNCSLDYGDVVSVSFPEWDVGKTRSHCRVVARRRVRDEIRLSLRCEDTSTGLSRLLEEYDEVASFSQSVESRRISREAFAYVIADLCAASTRLIPFLLVRNDAGGAGVDHVIGTERNRDLLAAFEIRPGRYDLSGLVMPRLLDQFSRLAAMGGQASLLIACYRLDRGHRVGVLSDLYFSRESHWHAFLATHRSEAQFRVFQLLVNPENSRSIWQAYADAGLCGNAESESPITRVLSRTLAQCALVDITDEVRGWELNVAGGGEGDDEAASRVPVTAKAAGPGILWLSGNDQAPRRRSPENRSATSGERTVGRFWAENTPAIPVFFFQSTGKPPVAKVGLPATTCGLAAYFEVEAGRFDFSALTLSKRVRPLVEAATVRGYAESILYLVKERVPEKPSFRILSIADAELVDRDHRQRLIDAMIGRDFRIIKLVAYRPTQLPDENIEAVLKQFSTLTSAGVAALRARLSGLVAIGDAVDATGRVHEMRYLAPVGSLDSV